MGLAFRSATVEDRAFVISSWETSYRKAHTAGLITMPDWAAVMRDQLTKILDRSYVKTTVAYEADDSQHIYGYLVSEPDETPPLVYWCYVKQPYRRQGMTYSLFRAAGIDAQGRWNFVCSAPVVSRILPKVPLAKWRPLLGRYSREHRDSVRD